MRWTISVPACDYERSATTALRQAGSDGADSGEPRNSPKGPEIDASSADIDRMLAECYSHPLIAPDVKQFVVPRRYDGQILDHFRIATPESMPNPIWAEIGTIRIIDKGGRSVRLCWFWEAHFGRMSFSYDGVRYLTSGKKFANDETLAFDALVRRINDEAAAAR